MVAGQRLQSTGGSIPIAGARRPLYGQLGAARHGEEATPSLKGPMFWAVGCCRQTALGSWGGAAGRCAPKSSPGLSDQQGGVLARARGGGHTGGLRFQVSSLIDQGGFASGRPELLGWQKCTEGRCMSRGIQESLFWSSAGVRFVWDGREVGVHWPARVPLSSICLRDYELVGARARGKRPHNGGERRPASWRRALWRPASPVWRARKWLAGVRRFSVRRKGVCRHQRPQSGAQ